MVEGHCLTSAPRPGPGRCLGRSRRLGPQNNLSSLEGAWPSGNAPDQRTPPIPKPQAARDFEYFLMGDFVSSLRHTLRTNYLAGRQNRIARFPLVLSRLKPTLLPTTCLNSDSPRGCGCVGTAALISPNRQPRTTRQRAEGGLIKPERAKPCSPAQTGDFC